MSKKVLVTGATGFIGGRLALHLVEKGYAVRGTGRRLERSEALLARGVELVAADLFEDDALKALCEGVDVVVHCAARSEAFGSFETFYDANVAVTERVLGAARACGATRFVFLSSPSIYFGGRDVLGAKEDYVPSRFIDPYAETKHIADGLVLRQDAPGFRTVSLRPRMVTGGGDDKFFPRFLEAIDRKKLTRVGGADPFVHITAIENLLDALVLAIEAKDEACGRTYNIGNAEPIRLFSMLETLCELTGRTFAPRRIPFPVAYAAASVVEAAWRAMKREDDPPLFRLQVELLRYSMTMDLTAAKTGLGYAPRVTNHETLERFAKYWASR
jgi:2-alkyl-3-oxoalkanoate reductase